MSHLRQASSDAETTLFAFPARFWSTSGMLPGVYPFFNSANDLSDLFGGNTRIFIERPFHSGPTGCFE